MVALLVTNQEFRIDFGASLNFVDIEEHLVCEDPRMDPRPMSDSLFLFSFLNPDELITRYDQHQYESQTSQKKLRWAGVVCRSSAISIDAYERIP